MLKVVFPLALHFVCSAKYFHAKTAQNIQSSECKIQIVSVLMVCESVCGLQVTPTLTLNLLPSNISTVLGQITKKCG